MSWNSAQIHKALARPEIKILCSSPLNSTQAIKLPVGPACFACSCVILVRPPIFWTTTTSQRTHHRCSSITPTIQAKQQQQPSKPRIHPQSHHSAPPPEIRWCSVVPIDDGRTTSCGATSTRLVDPSFFLFLVFLAVTNENDEGTFFFFAGKK